MILSAAQYQFALTYEISPIFLANGVAGNIPGAMLPIISLTEADSFVNGILGSAVIDPDDFFARFKPLPGGSLIENQVAMYPFANMAVAANAIIVDPLHISMLMICPAKGSGGYASKTMTMGNLQAQLAQHVTSGGTFVVVTPSFVYNNCLLLSLRDVSNTETKQAQVMWQWDFVQPLLTQQEAAQAQNTLMSKLSSGTPLTDPSWSGPSNSLGQPPSGLTASVVPAASSSGGALPGSASASSLAGIDSSGNVVSP